MAKHDDEFEGRDTVTLTLDDDSELECIVLNIFKGGDREYIALLPTEGIEAEEGTVYLYRYEEDEQGNPNLTNIESDEEYEIASDAFDEMLDDEEYDELVSEEELAAEEEDAKELREKLENLNLIRE